MTARFLFHNPPLGSGSFGVCFKATRNSDGNLVCLKVSQKIKTQAQRMMIQREIDVMKQLNHENIVRFYESFEENEQIIIVMEYIDGGTLESKTYKKNDRS